MGKIPLKARKELKKPLGRLFPSVRKIRFMKGRRIIAIGDKVTLELLHAGIRPHLAVFDLKCMRKRLDRKSQSILKKEFPRPKAYWNIAGSVSERIIKDASMLIRKGGALRIFGEEDLTALAFIKQAGKGDIILYGQPNRGVVMVVPNREIQKKVGRFLSFY